MIQGKVLCVSVISPSYPKLLKVRKKIKIGKSLCQLRSKVIKVKVW